MNPMKPWADSTSLQVSYSSGQSPKNFTWQWGQRDFDFPTIELSKQNYFGAIDEPGTTYEMTIKLGEPNNDSVIKLLSCVIICMMPPEGLEESIRCLHDTFDFYNHKPVPRSARLAPVPFKATITEKKKRPDLILEH
jgi:hypothetical protein